MMNINCQSEICQFCGKHPPNHNLGCRGAIVIPTPKQNNQTYLFKCGKCKSEFMSLTNGCPFCQHGKIIKKKEGEE